MCNALHRIETQQVVALLSFFNPLMRRLCKPLLMCSTGLKISCMVEGFFAKHFKNYLFDHIMLQVFIRYLVFD